MVLVYRKPSSLRLGDPPFSETPVIISNKGFSTWRPSPNRSKVQWLIPVSTSRPPTSPVSYSAAAHGRMKGYAKVPWESPPPQIHRLHLTTIIQGGRNGQYHFCILVTWLKMEQSKHMKTIYVCNFQAHYINVICCFFAVQSSKRNTLLWVRVSPEWFTEIYKKPLKKMSDQIWWFPKTNPFRTHTL